MPIFMLRSSDGSFFLQEADDADHARSLIMQMETMSFDPTDETIVSVLELERNTFSSRWFYETKFLSEEDESMQLGAASGVLDASVEAEIQRDSFPAIYEAYEIAVKQPIGDPSLPDDTPIIDPRNMAAWDETTHRTHDMIKQAIEFECKRFAKKKPKKLQTA